MRGKNPLSCFSAQNVSDFSLFSCTLHVVCTHPAPSEEHRNPGKVKQNSVQSESIPFGPLISCVNCFEWLRGYCDH